MMGLQGYCDGGGRVPVFNPKRLPAEKRRFIVRHFGESGRAWVADFPQLVEACVERWQLRLSGRARAGWPSNVIFYAEDKSGTALVLKVGYPHPEQVTEMVALKYYGGHGTPLLIDCSESLGATLMSRIEPGTTFRSGGNGIERSCVPLPLIGRLPRRCDALVGLPRFEDWLERAFAEFRQTFPRTHPFDRHVNRAERVYAEFRARNPENWLLHGDLHHENILMDRNRGWIAIDPKGVIGPRSMECGRFLHNFLEDEIEGIDSFAEASVDQLCRVMEVRVATFARTLGMAPEELLEANYVDAVLSFCWTVNSQPEYRDFQPVDAAGEMLVG